MSNGLDSYHLDRVGASQFAVYDNGQHAFRGFIVHSDTFNAWVVLRQTDTTAPRPAVMGEKAPLLARERIAKINRRDVLLFDTDDDAATYALLTGYPARGRK